MLGQNTVVIGLALLTTAIPVGAHVTGQPVALALAVVLSALVANYVSAAVPAALLCGFLFQNLFVAIASPAFLGPDEFNAARGYNFVSTVTMWGVLSASYWTGRTRRDGPARALMIATSATLALVVAYFALGAATDVTNAAIYLRNISLPLLLFQATLLATVRNRRSLTGILPVLTFAVLVYGYVELVSRGALYDLVNGHTYLGYTLRQQIEAGSWMRELQETGRVVRGIEDMLKVDLFNTSLLADLKIRLYRLQGPNFHSVSFAYAVSVLGLFRLAAGRPWPLLAALPLLVVIGSKGAIAVVVFAGGAILLFSALKSRLVFPALLVALGAFSLAAIAVGLTHGDYHVIGLFGGVNGFLHNPIGRGLGIGGNLSMNMAQIDWSRSQALGETDFAVESAVGVLLYQMGVAGLVVWLCPFLVALAAWRLALARADRTLAGAADRKSVV